jgi:hypothetical protein
MKWRQFMRPADWKMIGDICLALGIIFLIGGAWIWGNVTYGSWREQLQYEQYGGYSIPLLIAGVSLLVIGYFCTQRLKEEKSETRKE